jgi:hypothetical protein
MMRPTDAFACAQRHSKGHDVQIVLGERRGAAEAQRLAGASERS